MNMEMIGSVTAFVFCNISEIPIQQTPSDALCTETLKKVEAFSGHHCTISMNNNLFDYSEFQYTLKEILVRVIH